ncbi:MAG: hypothetical protein KIT16_10440 [Rhodospirillaceae bacterium]|nr:hypothetical protein [Rhodospirillaceae bacterium]
MVTRLPRVAFVGGADVGRRLLQILVDLRGTKRCDPVGVLPSHLAEAQSPKMRSYAEAAGVPVIGDLDELFNLAPLDLVVSAGNHKLFGERHIALPRLGIVNFHAAPLPEYRGSACAAFAILNGESHFGATFHKVERQLDAGDIIHIERFPILDTWSSGDIDDACVAAGEAAFRQLAPAMLSGELATSPQRLTSRAVCRRSDIDAYREIDPLWPHERIWRHVRACDWPGILKPCYLRLGPHKVYLTGKDRFSSI